MVRAGSLDRTRTHLLIPFQLIPNYEEEKRKSIVNAENHRRNEYGTEITEFITKDVPRETSFYDAKPEVLQTLSDFGIWDIVSKKNVPHNANILGGRCVFSIEDERTENEAWKASFVIQVYEEKLKISLGRSSAAV